MRIVLLTLLFAVTALCSCEKLGICVDRELQIRRADYKGDRLRMDGYYACPVDTDENGLILNEIIIFYKNGVALFPGDVSTGSEDLYLHAIAGSRGIKESKSCWGTFSIEDSLLQIAKWKPGPCGYPAVLRVGEIINDTTFFVSRMEIKGKHGTGTIFKSQYYRFKSFFPKFDSINEFVR